MLPAHPSSRDGSASPSLRWALFALAMLVAVSLGGCVPVGHLDASPVAGQVVDQVTHRPVVGAQVALSTFSPDHEARVQTDEEGRFHFPGFRHVEWVPLPYGFFRAPTGHLHVEADGYRAYDRGQFFDTEAGPGYGHFNASGDLLQVHIELARDRRRSSNAHR